MELNKVLLLAVLAFTLLTSTLARPHGASPNQELAFIASDLTETLNEVVHLLTAERSPRRRRRMVQFHMSRHVHHPKYYRRFRRGPRLYRSQRAGRNQDISDH